MDEQIMCAQIASDSMKDTGFNHHTVFTDDCDFPLKETEVFTFAE
jgi:hypothetical protein